MFNNNLFAVDGSDHATKALDIACDLAQRCGSKLIVLSVYRHHSALESTHTLVGGASEIEPPDATGPLTIDASFKHYRQAEILAYLPIVERVDSPAVGVLLDTFHMNIEEKDQAAVIRRAGDKLIHFHACGNDRGAPGADHIAWEAITAALRETNYDGAVVIESFTPDNQTIARAAAIWRPLAETQDALARDGLAFLRSAFA